MEKPSREHHSRSPPDEGRGQICRRFKGSRMRKWGSWVSEIRMPKTREKIWLGLYKTAEQAARAYDAAVYCLRGPNAKFNFPDSVPAIPSASSLSRHQIQVAAAKQALDEIPWTPPSLQCIKSSNKEAGEKPALLSQWSTVSETPEWSCTSKQISEVPNLWLWDSPFDCNGCLNFEEFPSIDEACWT